MQTVVNGLELVPAICPASEPQPHGWTDARPEPCSAPNCTRFARIIVNGKGACGCAHLASLLGAELAAEARTGAVHVPIRPALPVGQLLLRAGSVTEHALADALRAQRHTGAGRLGAWLRQQAGLGEQALAAALAAQQGCPVLSLEEWSPEPSLAPVVFLEHWGGIPLRGQGASGTIAVAFEDAGSPEMLRALTRVHGRPMRQAVLPSTLFWEAARTWLALRPPPTMVFEAASTTACVEECCSVLLASGARSAAFSVLGNCFWFRYTPEGSRCAHDLLCTVPKEAAAPHREPELENLSAFARIA